MNKLSEEIFQRTYQSYLCGGDIYTYRFASSSPNMKRKYEQTLKYLENNGYIKVVSVLEDKAKISITEAGIDYGNLLF